MSLGGERIFGKDEGENDNEKSCYSGMCAHDPEIEAEWVLWTCTCSLLLENRIPRAVTTCRVEGLTMVLFLYSRYRRSRPIEG